MDERMFTVTAKREEWDSVFEAFGACEGGEGYTSATHRAETRISEQLNEQGYEWRTPPLEGVEHPNEVLVARLTSKMEPLEVYNELKRLYGDRPEVVDDIRSLLGETGYQ
jgi:hypothetical protein